MNTTIEKIDPNSEEYKNKRYSLMKDFCPPIYPCKKCGHPVVKGYCCTTCRTSTPDQTEAQDLE